MSTFAHTSTRRRFLTAGAGIAAAGATLGCRSTLEEEVRAAEQKAALDERFAHLTDQRSTGTPIEAAERAARRQRLGRLLAADGYDAILMEGGATMRYLTGVSWGHSERLFGLIVLADGTHFWLAPSFEAGRAELATGRTEGSAADIVTWDEDEYAFRPLGAALRERGAERLAIEPVLRHRFAHGMAETLGASAVGIGTDVVVELRGVKSSSELALMRRANELTQSAIVAVAAELEPGMRTSEIRRMFTRAQERLGLRGVWCLCLLGPSAAYPHGDGSDTPLAKGDLILVDTGGAFHDYQSDNTRTWVFGAQPSERVTTIWNIVRDAQRAAFEAIRPGVACGSIDGVARGLIDERGFGPGYKTFTHRLGHGIGMEGHEDPYFDSGSAVVLKEGMTLSNEPGIYLEGELGLRIEDIVAVTQTGADHFGTWQEGPGSPA